jgi:hypothetical protein
MTENEDKYCHLRALGDPKDGQTLTKYVCYQRAFRDCPKQTASNRATQLEKRPEIQARIQELKDKTETSLVLSRQEKREFLARAVRVRKSEIDPEDPNDPNGDLIESLTRHYDKDGNHVRTTFRMVAKGKAIEIDNKMAGHNEPEEHNINVGGGVMLVPIGKGDAMDEWEKAAAQHQEGLKKDTNGG